ncbi:MAG: nucleoside hydrolase [Anaerolineales bacterium]|nr:nucleoside hydrolase [Anaerolineales bacterium]MCB8936807.1 nucleoside hydrolase [Ardenticatenaceae bacterium]
MDRILIDTDPGVDDAQAILLAAAHPKHRIEGLLAVAGNVGLEHTLRNSLLLTEVIDQKIPVYPGCAQPLVMFQEDAADAHGHDGLGDVGLVPQQRQAETEHAALALVRMANESPNEITLAAIGPLTNVAVALTIDPDLPKKLKRLVVMGGAVTGHGNTSSITAEFNIYFDPEAAHMVFTAWAKVGLLIDVVDWEVTKRHGFPQEVVNRWRTMDSPKAKFFKAITDKNYDRSFNVLKRPSLYAADPLALAVLLEPDIVTKAEQRHLSIEINGSHSRGQTIVDWDNRLGKPANANIILAVDDLRFQALMEQGLR